MSSQVFCECGWASAEHETEVQAVQEGEQHICEPA